MDAFSIIIFGGLALIFLVFIALGLGNRRTADITEKHQQRAIGEMARIEERDILQMVDAQNIYRRRRGAPETTEADIRARVGREELRKLDTADREAKNREHLHKFDP